MFLVVLHVIESSPHGCFAVVFPAERVTEELLGGVVVPLDVALAQVFHMSP